MLRIDDTAARSVALNIKPKTEMDPNDVGAKAMRLKKIWIFFMQKVFEYPLLHGYNGDIIFLEDDLIVSKDALTVLDFLSGCKNGHVTHIKNTKQDHYTHIHHTHFISLGGWGGENFVNAHPTCSLNQEPCRDSKQMCSPHRHKKGVHKKHGVTLYLGFSRF